MNLLPARIYQPLYWVSIAILTVVYYRNVRHLPRPVAFDKGKYWLMVVYAIGFIFFAGLRPIHYIFSDTVNYADSYYWLVGDPLYVVKGEGEWIWHIFMWWCAQHMQVEFFFLIVEVLYVVPLIIACKKLAPNRPEIMLLFTMSAFSFFSYGTNGIRNGMACSLIILALALMRGKMWEKIVAGLLAFVAFNCHRSTALPILCMVVCLFYGNTKHYIYFWVASIILSLVAGGWVESLFTGLEFDDRFDQYSTIDEDEAWKSSSLGFRWDFLLYSAMPIVLGWYIVFKRGIRDKEYSYLLNSYIACNAFWVMMIRAAYSNRFAYLSWFLYPIVLAYPLLKLPVFKERNNRKVAYILAAHTGFTLFMGLIYY